MNPLQCEPQRIHSPAPRRFFPVRDTLAAKTVASVLVLARPA